MAQDKESGKTPPGGKTKKRAAEEKLADLIAVVEAFLKRKASIGELRRALKRAQEAGEGD